jgi:twinkle protein
LVFSPESYPLAIHRRNIAEKFLKVKLVGVSDAKIKQASNFIRDHFEFMDCSRDDIGLDDILQKAVEANVNGLIIDPWNELEYDRPSGTSETDHIGQSLRKIRHFSRKNNIHTWILAHPQKQYKDQNGKYQKPSPYDIAGSAHWYNKADNCLVVYRNEQDVPEIHVDKIKFSFFGEKGKATLKYNPAYRGYDDTEENAWDPKTVW